MGLYQSYDADLVANVTFADGFTVRLRSALHPRMRALEKQQLKKYRHFLSGSAVPEDVELKMELETVRVAVESWDGATDRDGNPLDCTPENVTRVMTDLPYLRKDLLFAVRQPATFQKQELAELGKSAAPSSGPSSSTPVETTSSED